MAQSDKIGSEDIFKDDLFQKQTKSAGEFEEKIKLVSQGLEKILQDNKKLFDSIKVDSAESIKQLNAALKQSETARKGLISIEKQEEKLRQEKVKTDRELIKNAQEEEKVKQQAAKTAKENANATKAKIAADKAAAAQSARNAKQTAKLNSLYQQESARLNDLRKRLKELSLAGRTTGKVFKGLQSEVSRLDKRLKAADASAGQFQRNVGNYPNRLKGAISSIGRFASALGVTTGVAALGAALRSSVNIFRTFEKAQTDVASILQKTKSEIGDLTQQAKDLGATTFFTATEVSKLQIELAKLGFDQTQIQDATEGVLDLAAAFNIDLAQSAKVVAGTLNGFGLRASESSRVADVLAKSFATSALDIEKFEVAISKVAPIAKGLNVDIETTTAVLGQLVNANFDASTAGTQFRNILLKLSNPASELANTLGFTVESSDDLVDSFKTLNKEQLSVAEAQGLIDVRSVALLKNLADNVDKVEELRAGLEDAGGTASKIAGEQLKTLDGSLRLLSSAYEGFVLSIEDGDGVLAGFLRKIIQITSAVFNLLTNTEKTREQFRQLSPEVQSAALAISEIINGLGNLIKLLFDFRGIIINTVIGLKAYSLAVKVSRTEIKLFSVAQKVAAVTTALFTGNLKKARVAVKAFNLSLKGSPLGLLAAALSIVGAELLEWIFLSDDATDANERNLKSLEARDKAYLQHQQTLAALNLQLKEAEARSNIISSILVTNDFALRDFRDVDLVKVLSRSVKDLAEEEAKRARNSILFDEGRVKSLEKIIKTLKEELKLRGVSVAGVTEEGTTGLLNDLRQQLKIAREERDLARSEGDIKLGNARIKNLQDEIKRLESLGQAEEKLAELKLRLNKLLRKSTDDLTKAEQRLNKATLTIETNEIADEINKIQRSISDFVDFIDATDQLAKNEGKGIFFRKGVISREDTENIKKDINDQFNLIKDGIDKRVALERESNNKLSRLADEKLIQDNKDRLESIDLTEVATIANLKAAGASAEEIAEAEEIFNKRRLNSTDRLFVEKAALSEEFRLKNKEIDRKAAEDEDELERKRVERLVKIEEDRLDKILELNLSRLSELEDLSQKFLAGVQRELEAEQRLRASALEAQVNDRQNSANRQLELAKKGINNQFAFEEAKAAEARKNQLENERKAQNAQKAIQLAGIYLTSLETRMAEALTNQRLQASYASTGASGKAPGTTGVTTTNAPLFAIKDTFLAEAFVSAFGGNFATGVEDFQGKGTGTSDSNIIGFSHGESVVTAKGTEENRGLVTAMNEGNVEDYFMRVWMPKFSMDNSSKHLFSTKEKDYTDYKLLNEIKSLKETMASRPVQQVDVDSFGNIIETSFRNGAKTVTTHKRKTFI